MEEEWKEIDRYNGCFSISNIGNIRNNLTGRILKKRVKGECVYISTTLNNEKIHINIKKEFIFYFFNDKEYQLYRIIDGNVKNISIYNFRKENRKYRGNIRNSYKIIDNYVEGYTYKNEMFLIDLEDLELIENHKWYKRSNGYISCSSFYGKGSTMFLHRAIMSKYNDIKNKDIDHKNRNRVDNRKENLRIANRQQNNFNQSIGISNTTGFIGIYLKYNNTKKKGITEYWRAQIRYNGKHISKCFKTKENALKWRLQKELEYYGEFAPQSHLFEEYEIKGLTK